MWILFFQAFSTQGSPYFPLTKLRTIIWKRQKNMRYRNNLILSNQFHEKNREINVELFSSNLISRKKFREINFSFNFTLHRYFSKMNYVNAFFPSFFGAEGLGGFRNVSKMNYVNTFFPSFFGAEGLGAFRNVSKMNYVNTFFPSFLIWRTRRVSQCFQDELRKRFFFKLFWLKVLPTFHWQNYEP